MCLEGVRAAFRRFRAVNAGVRVGVGMGGRYGCLFGVGERVGGVVGTGYCVSEGRNVRRLCGEDYLSRLPWRCWRLIPFSSRSEAYGVRVLCPLEIAAYRPPY